MQVESRKNDINFTSVVPLVVMKVIENGEAIAPVAALQETEITKVVRLLSDSLSLNKKQFPYVAVIQDKFMSHDRSFCTPNGQYIKANTKQNNNFKYNTIKSVLEDGDMYLATGEQSNDIIKHTTKAGIIQNKILNGERTLEDLSNEYARAIEQIKSTAKAQIIQNKISNARITLANLGTEYQKETEQIRGKINKYFYESPLLRLRESFSPQTREYFGDEVNLVVTVKEIKKAGKKAAELIIDSIDFVKKTDSPKLEIIPKPRGLHKTKTKPFELSEVKVAPEPTAIEAPSSPNLNGRKKQKKYVPNLGQLNLLF